MQPSPALLRPHSNLHVHECRGFQVAYYYGGGGFKYLAAGNTGAGAYIVPYYVYE